MQIVRAVTEQDMIRAFVEAEAESPVYGAAYAQAARELGGDRAALFAPEGKPVNRAEPG
jgi:hypothetical protein